MEAYAAAPTHDLVWVTGSDAVGFLDGLLSQAVEPMAPRSVRRSFLLAPNGKVRALLWLLRDEERVGVVADAGLGSRVIEDLTRFKLRVDIAFSPPRPLHMVVSAAAHAETPMWKHDGDGVRVYPGHSPLGLRSMVPDDAQSLSDEAQAAARIEAAWPVMGVDVDESTIPQETRLVGQSVDFTKGCYLGQELVARIDSRGHVNKRLARVRVASDGSGPPAGAVVVSNEVEAGVLTTTAPGVGMGLIRREVNDGDRVQVIWNDATVEGELIDIPDFS